MSNADKGSSAELMEWKAFLTCECESKDITSEDFSDVDVRNAHQRNGATHEAGRVGSGKDRMMCLPLMGCLGLVHSEPKVFLSPQDFFGSFLNKN